MTQILDYGPNQLKATDGAWKTWQFSAREFMDQNKIDMTSYLEASWINGPTSNLNQTPSTFYQLLDGTALLKGSVIWNDTANTDAIIPIFDFTSQFWADLLINYSYSIDAGTCIIRSIPEGSEAVVLPGKVIFGAGNIPQNFSLLNSSTPYSFDANSVVEIDFHLIPYFGE